MELKKERNFIAAYNTENGTLEGRVNLTTWECYGKRNTVVKSNPRVFSYSSLRHDIALSNIYAKTINFILSNKYEYTPTRAARLEEMISLGILPNSINSLDTKTRLTKDVVQFIKEECDSIYYISRVNAYVMSKQYKDFLRDRPEWFKVVFYSYVDTAHECEIPIDFLKSFLNRCLHEHVNEFFNEYSCNTGIIKMITGYYRMSMELYGEVKITPNILSNFAQLKYLNNEYKKAHYNEILNKYNNKDFLYFNYGDYEGRPLLTKEEFHDEATVQHNCVERLYMEKVSRNETYIVSFRNKNNSKMRITCEVDHYGNIQQFLGAYNSRNLTPEQNEMYYAYKSHLADNITNEGN